MQKSRVLMQGVFCSGISVTNILLIPESAVKSQYNDKDKDKDDVHVTHLVSQFS